MKHCVLVTGSGGFVGRNLVTALRRREDIDLITFDIQDSPSLLDEALLKVDVIYHLAGVNRPEKEEEFALGNSGLTSDIVQYLKKHGKTPKIILTSSIQAELDNPYGKSKKAAEEILLDYNRSTGAMVAVYQLPGVFGKWSRPNYNTVVATFCHNIARDIEINVSNPDHEIELVYIDDVVADFMRHLGDYGSVDRQRYSVPRSFRVTLGDLADRIRKLHDIRKTLVIPDLADDFMKCLHATYLSFLPEDGFSYPLKMNIDERGSFTEFLKTPDRGQVSINISKPGITKGNHWHHTKNEKFLVVSGQGVIRFRKIGSKEIIEYNVSGEKLEVIDIPIGYTHNISNIGECDMVTVMWVNEVFDPENPDTIFELV